MKLSKRAMEADQFNPEEYSSKLRELNKYLFSIRPELMPIDPEFKELIFNSISAITKLQAKLLSYKDVGLYHQDNFGPNRKLIFGPKSYDEFDEEINKH